MKLDFFCIWGARHLHYLYLSAAFLIILLPVHYIYFSLKFDTIFAALLFCAYSFVMFLIMLCILLGAVWCMKIVNVIAHRSLFSNVLLLLLANLNSYVCCHQ